MDTKKRQKKYRLQGAESAHLAQHLGAKDQAGIAELKKLAGRIEAINASKAAMSLDKRAGFIFEEVHAGTFNAAARKAGDLKTTALTGGTGGFAGDQRVDIRIVRGDKIVAEAQAKCCRTAARSAVASAKPKYEGTQRIVPDDQTQAARDILSTSARAKATSQNPRMREIGTHRQEAAAKVTNKLKAAGHESKGITHEQAQTLASGDMSSINRTVAVETAKSAATNAAWSGLAVSTAISAATSLAKVANGELSVKDAAKAVAADGATGAARAAATAVAAEGVKVVAKRALSANAARVFAAGSGPIAVAGCAVELVTDAYKGELTVEKAARSTTRAAGGWAGAEGGALVGSAICPGIGTVIGAVIGGIGGSWLGGLW